MNAFYLLTVFILVHSAFGHELRNDANLPHLPEVYEDQLKSVSDFHKNHLRLSEISTVNESKQAGPTMKECFINVWDSVKPNYTIPKDIMNMRDVINEYCEKKTEFLNCVDGFAKTLAKYMDAKDKIKEIMRVSKSLLDFVCDDDAERIVLFYIGNGGHCINSKLTEIQFCLKAVNIDSNLQNIDYSMWIKEKGCNNFDKVQNCLVRTLKRCDNRMPANVAKETFEHIGKLLMCKLSSGNSLISTRLLILLFSLLVLYQNF